MRTSCTPPVAVAATADPRDHRKYHNTHAMAAAPAAVTAIWAGVIKRTSPREGPACLDPHAVERAPHKYERHGEEPGRQEMAQGGATLRRQRNGELDRQQPEQRRELDDR